MRVVALLASAWCVACSSTSTTLDASTCLSDDSGYDADASPIITQMNPPHPPEHACTSGQLSDYAQCQGAKDETLCKQFESGGAGTACGACMESQASDPTWGVIVFNAQAGSFNVEGCVDLVLGEVGDAENPTCGELLHESYECQNENNATLCNTCSDDASSECEQIVLTTACAAQNNAVLDPAGRCAALFSDAAQSPALACFPSLDDGDAAQQQEIAWLVRVGAIFCGP